MNLTSSNQFILFVFTVFWVVDKCLLTRGGMFFCLKKLNV